MKTEMNNKKVVVPDWFTIGAKFKGKWINYGSNTCKVLSFDVDKNKLHVEIETDGHSWEEDDWNLQVTLWGFDSLDYIAI